MASPADYDPYTTPAMKPPNGQLPNFGNSETMHVWLVATAVICLTVSLLSILLRTFVKVALIRRVEVEDCTSMSLKGDDNFCTVKMEPLS